MPMSMWWAPVPNFLTVRSFEVAGGRFLSDLDLQRNSQVAVIGGKLEDRLFDNNQALGKQIRVGGVSLTVIGVLEEKGSKPGP